MIDFYCIPLAIPDFFNIISEGIGIGVEHILFLLCLIGCAFFFLQDVRIGILITFFVSGLFFMLFYLLSVPYTYALTALMATIVLLALSLFILRLREENIFS